MKTKIKILAVFAALFCVNRSQAQLHVSTADEGMVFQQDTEATFTSFTATVNAGIIYLKWTMIHLKRDGAFVVYRSADNKNFEMIGTKPGAGVPVSYAIAYYFADERPPSADTLYYKLVFIGNKTFLASDKITVTYDHDNLITGEAVSH